MPDRQKIRKGNSLRTNNKMVAAIAIAALLAGGSGAIAQQGHDSNTLHKIGKAIQYPFRKAGENLDVDIHRGENKKSVEVDRHKREKFVVTPGGEKIYKGSYGSYGTHRRHHRHHHAHA